MVMFLIRVARPYQREEEELERDVPSALRAETPGRHVAMVLIDRLDLATARAVQYARAFQPTSCEPCTSCSRTTTPKS